MKNEAATGTGGVDGFRQGFKSDASIMDGLDQSQPSLSESELGGPASR